MTPTTTGAAELPGALRLADALQAVEEGWHVADKCCAMLRSQHARIAELEAENEALRARGAVPPCQWAHKGCDTPNYCESVQRCTARDSVRAQPAGAATPAAPTDESRCANCGKTANEATACISDYPEEGEWFCSEQCKHQHDELNCPHLTHNGYRHPAEAQRLIDCEAALRSLASWLGVGGYNADTVCAKVFEEKIRWGVEHLLATPAAPAPVVPSGWKPVPAEPTADMVRAGWGLLPSTATEAWDVGATKARKIYAAMLAAAPQPPAVNPTRQLLAQVDPATGSIVGYFSDEKPPFPQPTVTAGAVDALVPIEPTETMWEAFDQYNGDKYTGHSTWLTAWSAMLKAAPQPTPSPAPAQPGQEGEPAGRFMDEADERKSAKEGYEKRITRVSERNPNDEGMYTLGWWDRAWKAAARAAPQPATADAVDCSGGSPCSTCPDKKKCSRGCVRQGGRA